MYSINHQFTIDKSHIFDYNKSKKKNHREKHVGMDVEIGEKSSGERSEIDRWRRSRDRRRIVREEAA